MNKLSDTKQEVTFFLKNPKELSLEYLTESDFQKVKTLFGVYLLCMALLVLSSILIATTDSLLYVIKKFSIWQSLKLNNANFDSDWGGIAWIITVIYAPLLEEVVFRLPLTNDRRLFALSLGFAVFYFSGDFYIVNFSKVPLWRIVISISVSVLCYLFLSKNRFLVIRSKFFNYMCWILIVSFSWIHIGNFTPLNWTFIYLYPIYVLPQLFYGIGLSFLMVKYNNILWPIMLHMLINGLPAILRALW